ncbi:MAG: DEAD/DEAH box helicase [Bacteriovoracia bacterium]
MKQFADFGLHPGIQQALKEAGYETPTPIQQQAIPLVLQGHDLLGIAQTGTGKTAAFCLPILNLLLANPARPDPRSPRVLILTPTRELAIQIHQNLQAYGRHLKLKHAVIFGGVSQNRQVNALQAGVDVLVATPGRLLDLIQQRHVRLSNVGIFVLDEADRMLDMGFLRDIKKIVPLLPPKRHNLFFSATMPKEIQALANTILRNPQKVEVTPPATTVKLIEQSAMYVTKAQKLDLLVHLLKQEQFSKTLVFVEMKHIANRVTETLLASGIKAVAIHGNKSQNHRQAAIQQFANGQMKVLVATDIASRGIDIDGITHVINFELSNIAESYVHRIGRTARAGATGVAISLVTGDEKSYLANIERTTNQTIAVNVNQPFHSDSAARATVMSVGKAKALIEGQRKTRGSGGFRGGSSGGNFSRPKPAHARRPSHNSGSRFN